MGVLLSFILFLTACGMNEESKGTDTTDRNTQPIHFESNNDQNRSIGERGGYPQSEQLNVNRGNEINYTDIYANDKTEKLRKQLVKTKDIVQAQVAETDDEIIVAVILSQAYQKDIASQDEVEDTLDRIENKVKEILPNTNKEIIVYTDTMHWHRMKNIDARTKNRENNGEKSKQYEFIE